MYTGAITGDFAGNSELVALCDNNPGRLALRNSELEAKGAKPVPAYDAADFDRMVSECRPDVVIVTTRDCFHDVYIVRAMELGCDVITEKPMTTDAAKCARILETQRRTGRKVTVTFNYRYAPPRTQIKDLLMSGVIGNVLSVSFEWLLNTRHGADYFRRWHRNKANSGGLMVHKATHHFDLVNWWLCDSPVRVYASGGLRFYGAENARKRGLGERPARGSVDDARRDRFSLDMRLDPELRRLYLEQEGHDGYLRDRDVFDDGITIEDNLSLVVDYASGASMAYTLSAHGPWEGYTVAINGTEGRAELTVVERGAVLFDAEGRVIVDPSADPVTTSSDDVRPTSERLVVQRHFEKARVVPIAKGSSGHGGGDELLLQDVFRGVSHDPLGRTANWLDGVRSVAVGLAGNRSLASGQPVNVDALALGVEVSL